MQNLWFIINPNPQLASHLATSVWSNTEMLNLLLLATYSLHLFVHYSSVSYTKCANNISHFQASSKI